MKKVDKLGWEVLESIIAEVLLKHLACAAMPTVGQMMGATAQHA